MAGAWRDVTLAMFSLFLRDIVTVILLAGFVGKSLRLAQLEGTIAGLVGGTRFSMPLAIAIVAIEGIVAAALLVSGPVRTPALLAALLLFLCFAGGIGFGLLRGRRVRCACFGALGHILSWSDILRAFSLAAASGAALAIQPAPIATPLRAAIFASAALACAVWQAWHRRRALVRDRLTVPIGEPLPDVTGERVADGAPATTTSLASDPAIIVFFAYGCPICRERKGELADLLPGIDRAGIRLWVIADDGPGSFEMLAASRLSPYLVRMNAAERRKLNPLGAVPFYLLVGSNGRVEASNYMADENWLSVAEQLSALGQDRTNPVDAPACPA